MAILPAFLALYPTVMLLVGSFSDAPLGVPGRFTLVNYTRAYGDPQTYWLIGTSVVFAAGSSLLSLALGGLLAWITIRTNAPGRRVFQFVALAPNVLPPVLIATSWALLLSPRIGILNLAIVRPLGLPPLNIYSLPGMVAVEGLILTPLAFIILAGAFHSMDPAFEEAALITGSSSLQTARRITVPLVLPAGLAAGMLNFVRAVESFDTPAIIALPARIDVLTTKIFREALADYPPNHNLAATYGTSLLAITMLSVLLYRSLTRGTERFATITSRAYRSHTVDLGRWRYAASAAALLILCLVVLLPVAMLLLTSVLPFYEVPTRHTLGMLTLKHYAFLLENDRVRRALHHSLTLAGVGATAAMLLATSVAYVTVRTRAPGRGVLEALTFIPWAFPGTALAIGLLWGYVRIPVPIYATIWILLIAYVTRFLPFGLRVMTGTMVQVHGELEEASRVCGAGLITTFRRILFPLLRPGFIAGWTLLATIFMREFSTSLFLYTPRSEPLGPLLYHLWMDGAQGRMAALGVVVSLVSLALIALVRRVARLTLPG
ncbi:MAG: iron ABC transporter permease [Armatimonadota bacterium]|nr:iron ABC transporter permease [Armatimonadota bacterium]